MLYYLLTILIGLVIISGIYLAYRDHQKEKPRVIVLTGQQGKTRLFSLIKYGEYRETVPSADVNETMYEGNRIVDVPSHPKLKDIRSKYLKHLVQVVYVLSNGNDIVDLYELVTSSLTQQIDLTLTILYTEPVSIQLEYELEIEKKIAEYRNLGSGEAFRFADLNSQVEFKPYTEDFMAFLHIHNTAHKPNK